MQLTAQYSLRDKVLFYGLLSWFLIVFSLSIVSNVQSVQREFMFIIAGSHDAQSYPIVDFLAENEDTPWQIGDEILSVDGKDLRGASTLRAFALVTTQASDGQAQVVIRRGGVVDTVDAIVEEPIITVSTSLTVFVMALCGVIAFLGTSPTYLTRVFYTAAICWSIHGCYFYGLSVSLTYLFIINYSLFGCAMLVCGFRALAVFPQGVPPETNWFRIWPWLVAIAIQIPAMSLSFNVPFRSADVIEARVLTMVLVAVLAIGLTIRNYRQAGEAQRSQVKWVLLGTYLVSVPMALLALLMLVSPKYQPLVKLFEMTTIAFPICWLIAMLGYRALDIDRVFSSVVTYTITVGAALFLVGGLLPPIATMVIEYSGLEAQLVYVLLSFAVCGALIPTHKYLKPRIEGRFFPARQRLDRAAFELSEMLIQAESEDQLLNTLGAGLANMQGSNRWHITSHEQPINGGHVLRLEPSVGERVFIHLGKKESGDVFTARDIEAISELSQQAERLLLKLRNQELVTQRRAAEQLAAEKSLFLASASHDLRQPMHALGLFSESLRKRNRDERLAPLVEHINRSTKALDGMFNSILDLSKIDAGAMTAEPGAVYVQLLFEELELEFADAAKAKGLDLRFVPSSAVVWSDANLLTRILRNLISNAIRYTQEGKVLVGCRLGYGRIRIQVADTGRGISAEDQARIFTAYARVDNHVEGGLGLGLSLVDKLCGLLDHKLELQSVVGKGSMFTVEADVALADQIVSLELEAGAVPDTPLKDLRVLVVDDDPAIRLALHELLVSWRSDVESLESLTHVQQWLAHRPQSPQLVLVDLHLDERNDGVRILEAIEQQLGDVPALIVTGDAQAGTYKWVAGRQISILNKPLGAEKLQSAILQILSQHLSLAGQAR